MSPHTRTGWRVCIGEKNSQGKWMVSPLFPTKDPTRPAEIGKTLTGTHHVGTTQKFVLDYYSGCCALSESQCELLLELDCAAKSPQAKELWEMPAGTEAVIKNPLIRNISILKTGPQE